MIGQLQSGPVCRVGAVQQLCNARREEGRGGGFNECVTERSQSNVRKRCEGVVGIKNRPKKRYVIAEP